ncbi:hypothetical protein [Laceyella putida]|uniref:Uncharacterized protein n=1 Tax=Laceyella putida TaxID=110101 RepID=A0ABW2RLN3_9BACL
MNHASQLESISILGRMAFAIACLEQVCQAWWIFHEQIRAIFSFHGQNIKWTTSVKVVIP